MSSRAVSSAASLYRVSGWIDTTEVVLLDGVIDFYSQEIRTKTNTAAAYHQRGLIWEFQGQKDKAIADYTEAIRLDPKCLGLIPIVAKPGPRRMNSTRRSTITPRLCRIDLNTFGHT